MRVSTQRQSLHMERAVLDAAERLTDAQRRVVSGRRLEQPSDDPTDTTHALALKAILHHQEQFQRNIREAKLFLQVSETAMSEINDLLHQARELVVRGANDALDRKEREAIAAQVGKMLERLYQIANQRVDDERYLFGGQRVNTLPFSLNGEELLYQGDDQPLNALVAPEHTVPMNLPGSPLVDLYAALQQIKRDLENSNLARLANEDLELIQEQQERFGLFRAQIGARLDELDRYHAQYETLKEYLSDLLAKKMEVDLPSAISELRRSELAYEAALQVAARLEGLNLFDFLRGGSG